MKLRLPEVDSITAIVEDFPAKFKKLFDVDLDFSIKSIEHIEEIIESIPSTEDPSKLENMSDFLVAMGCYVGEVIRRESGGEWLDTSDKLDLPLGLRINSNLGENLYLSPIAKVIKRYRQGKEHNLVVYAITNIAL